MNNQRKFLILAVFVGIVGVGIGAVTIFSMDFRIVFAIEIFQ